MSVLVGLPYHPNKRYALEYVYDWVNNQTHTDVEVVSRWHMGPFGEDNAVKAQREFFRRLAVERGHDHFYSMGTDTIPPLDVIDRLLAHDKDIAGAVYRQRKDKDQQVIAWRHGDDEKKFMNEKGLVEVDGMGMDAVLFSREAFTSFTFFDWGQNDDDYPAYDLLKTKGFTVWLDTSLVCRHYMTKQKFV
jgi:hypothetical protein